MNESIWVAIKLGDVFESGSDLFLVDRNCGEGIVHGKTVTIWQLQQLKGSSIHSQYRHIYQQVDKLLSYLKDLRKLPEPEAFELMLTKEIK